MKYRGLPIKEMSGFLEKRLWSGKYFNGTIYLNPSLSFREKNKIKIHEYTHCLLEKKYWFFRLKLNYLHLSFLTVLYFWAPWLWLGIMVFLISLAIIEEVMVKLITKEPVLLRLFQDILFNSLGLIFLIKVLELVKVVIRYWLTILSY